MINAFCRKPLWECTKTLADVAQGRMPADAVITHAKLVNVCTAEIQEDIDVAIVEGRIAYVGRADHCIGETTRVIDATGSYIAPGFLDGHIHVESSMIGVAEASLLMKETLENNADLLFPTFGLFALGFVILTLPMGLIFGRVGRKMAVKH